MTAGSKAQSLGALGGAVLGDVLGGRHGHGLGAGLGALGGAAVGNGLADARNTPCPSYPPPPPPEYIRESYEAPPPPRPDDGLMHWAGSLQGRIARDHDAGLLTNGQSRRLQDQINQIRQHVGELRWSSGGYLYPEDVEGLRSQLGGIGHDLDKLEVLGS